MFKGNRRQLCLLKFMFAVATGSLVMSCGITKMYSGPDLPPNQVAIIQSATSSVTLVSCDEKKVPNSRVSVLPGEHLIEMSFNNDSDGIWMSWSLNNSFFTFAAEAGHTYSVDWKPSPNNQNAYIVVLKDMTTGQQVPYTRGKPRQAMATNQPGRFFQIRNPNKPQEIAVQWSLPNEKACLTFLSIMEGAKELAPDIGCSAVSQSASLPCAVTIKDKALNTTMNIEFPDLESCRRWGNNDKFNIVEPCKCDRKNENTNRISSEKESSDSPTRENGRYFRFTNPFDLQVMAQLDLQSETNCMNYISRVQKEMKGGAQKLLEYVSCHNKEISVSLPHTAVLRDKISNITFSGSFATLSICQMFIKDKDTLIVTGCK